MSLFLPKLFRWTFTVLAVLTALAAVGLIAAILIDPELPPGTRFGPFSADFMGQPASIALHPDAGGQGELVLDLRAFHGNVAVTVDRPAGAIELFKSYGLPVLLIYAVFFTALFELLRRLFRNVGHGHSFTPQSVRLVQIVGGSLIVFSLLSAIGESWFAYAMYGYLVEHTQFVISGTPVHLPPAECPPWLGYESPLGSPEFLAGLLVLALAEVFRQGLALQRDNDLTV
ncbi:MAG: DUF2975 domain-containing protein [Steroidobacteraceae bacterium]